MEKSQLKAWDKWLNAALNLESFLLLGRKKGSKSECINYRPISLLSVASKVIEHLLCSQLKSHLLEHNLQNEHQWGFRLKRSTEDALLYLTEKWRKAINSGKVVILLIDFKKAFDSVSHQILLKKLSAFGVSGDFLSYLESYLLDRKQSTTVNGAISNVANVEYGIPQGFSAYVNDIAGKPGLRPWSIWWFHTPRLWRYRG